MRETTPTTSGPGKTSRRDVVVAASCGALVALMVGASYAAVPLYDWFCRTTGYGGATQVASAAPGEVLGRRINVRFDSNVGGGLPWRVTPEVTSIDVRLGEVVTVYYAFTNLSARATTGIAAYNVAPTTSGGYFNKINCFCFTEQTLAAGEKRELAVVFFVDPALATDAEMHDLDTITLSYTLYPARQPDKPVAESARAGSPGRI